jgi:hypothetical protein
MEGPILGGGQCWTQLAGCSFSWLPGRAWAGECVVCDSVQSGKAESEAVAGIPRKHKPRDVAVTEPVGCLSGSRCLIVAAASTSESFTLHMLTTCLVITAALCTFAQGKDRFQKCSDPRQAHFYGNGAVPGAQCWEEVDLPCSVSLCLLGADELWLKCLWRRVSIDSSSTLSRDTILAPLTYLFLQLLPILETFWTQAVKEMTFLWLCHKS